MYDVVIVGAGPAGATAAALLAAEERSVLLVDRDTFPRKQPVTQWLNAKAVKILAKIGLELDKRYSHPFSAVTFHNAEFSKSAIPKLKGETGHVIHREQFEHALIQTAVEAGAEFRQGFNVRAVKLHEPEVELIGEEQSCSGRMLILAAGHADPLTIGVFRLNPARTASYAIAGLEVTGTDSENAAVDVVLGLDKQGGFGLLIRCGKRACVEVCGFGDGRAQRTLLGDVCKRCAASGLLSADHSILAAQSTIRRCPAGTALEMDSHVGKHTLVIGDAGGFVSASSAEGLYPGIWSAQLAVEVVNRALDSVHSQDILMEFDSKWRIAMADYLRPPNTDIQFLLPLIFSNQPMADRMGAAFFRGENI